MLYAYHIFGIVYRSEEEMYQMINESTKSFEGIDGLVSRQTFQNVDDQIASALFICDDLETVGIVKEIMNELIEKYDEFIGFTTEFSYKILEDIKYRQSYYSSHTSHIPA